MEPTLQNAGKRGVAMVLAVFAIAFLSVLAVAMLDQATTDAAILRNHASGLQALYAAHAGVSDAVVALRALPLTVLPVSGTLALPDGSTCNYTATIDNQSPIVTVTSTGTAYGFTRKVRARLLVTGLPLLSPYSVLVDSWQEVVGP